MNADIRQAAARLGEYHEKGNELVFKLCPYCHGGDHRDRYSAAMNAETGAFNCKRGSCGVGRSFRQLCEDFHIPVEERRPNTYYGRPAASKRYKMPSTQPQPLTTAAQDYLLLRKISVATQQAFRIGCDGHGNIVFPFFETATADKPVFVKYRPAHKVQQNERKSWRDTDTKPVLFGMWRCDPVKPLCIFEGEIDALSGSEAGIPNSVSVPSGCEDTGWLDTCYDWLQQFDSIYLFGDNDEPGRQMQQKLRTIFSEDHRVFIVEHPCKDANELLFRQGAEAVRSAYDTAHEVPPYGIIDLAAVTSLDIRHVPRVQSEIRALDARLGGFLMGELTVLTGRRGEGKSTLAGQFALSAVNQGKNVCLYSGEMRADRVQHWLNLQAAGSAFLDSWHDEEAGRDVYTVRKDALDKIKAWYAGRFWLYDNNCTGANDADSILRVFSYAAKRYGCEFFVVDNLMTCRYSGSDRDFYRQQSSLVGEFIRFAKQFNVHVLLCAHPRKAGGSLGNDDVSGSGDITNRADNVLSLERLDEKAQAEQGVDSMLSILKNRGDGASGTIGLRFDRASRRLFVPSEGEPVYGWHEAPPEWTQTEIYEILPY